MSIENYGNINQKSENIPDLIITGIDNGVPVYEENPTKMPDLYPGTPHWVFDKMTEDINSLPENNAPMKFKVGETVLIGINSSDKVRYEIFHGKNGYYFLSRIDNDNTQKSGTFLLSHEPRTEKNPDLIVCSEKEIEDWLN